MLLLYSILTELTHLVFYKEPDHQLPDQAAFQIIDWNRIVKKRLKFVEVAKPARRSTRIADPIIQELEKLLNEHQTFNLQ